MDIQPDEKMPTNEYESVERKVLISIGSHGTMSVQTTDSGAVYSIDSDLRSGSYYVQSETSSFYSAGYETREDALRTILDDLI